MALAPRGTAADAGGKDRDVTGGEAAALDDWISIATVMKRFLQERSVTNHRARETAAIFVGKRAQARCPGVTLLESRKQIPKMNRYLSSAILSAVLVGAASVPTMAVPSVQAISTTSAVEQVRSDRHSYRRSHDHWRHSGYSSRRHNYRGDSSYRSHRSPGFSIYLGTPSHRYGDYGRRGWY